MRHSSISGIIAALGCDVGPVACELGARRAPAAPLAAEKNIGLDDVELEEAVNIGHSIISSRHERAVDIGIASPKRRQTSRQPRPLSLSKIMVELLVAVKCSVELSRIALDDAAISVTGEIAIAKPPFERRADSIPGALPMTRTAEIPYRSRNTALLQPTRYQARKVVQ